MINTGERVRKSLCRACHQMRPSTEMHYQYAGRNYCSAGCRAKAAWLFTIIPGPRRAS